MRPTRPLTALSIVALVSAGLVAGAGAAASADTANVSTGPADAAYAPDVATAQAIAVAHGHAVGIDALTTAQEQTSVLPDGSFSYAASTLPVRVKKAGEWIPVSTKLVHDGAWFEPAASAAPVRFSAGGAGILDEVQTPSGDWITESWPYGTLPAPTVSGETATYADVLPGVDLKLTATETGMSSVYVVKSATAAFATVLDSLHVTMGGAKVARQSTGEFTADPGHGQPVRSGTPLWWDSAEGGDGTAPGGDEPLRPVTASLTATGPSMDVSATLGAAPVTYPVYVDPDWSSGDSFWWYTDKAYPTTSYSNAAILRVGIYSTYQSDMFFEFPIGALSGKVVQSATLATTQTEIDACPTNAISIETYGPQGHGFTWNQEQSWGGQWGGVLQTQTPGSCSNTTASVPVGWNVTGGVRQKLGQQIVQFGIHSATSAPSRRHFAPGATLTVTYDTPPNTPTSPAFVGLARACSTNSAAPVMFNGNQNVTVQVNQTDPDPGNVADNFYLEDFTTSVIVSQYGTALQAQGLISWTFDARGLSATDLYGWWARGSDYVVDGASNGPTCYFRIDNTAPSAPTVSTTTTTMVIGQPITETLTAGSATDVVGFEYWLTPTVAASPPPAAVLIGKTAATPACGTLSGSAGFACLSGSTAAPVVAPIDDNSELWVASYDAAGNISTATGLPLVNSDGSSATPASTAAEHTWLFSQLSSPLPSVLPDGNTTAASDTTGQKDLSVGSGIALTSTSTIRAASGVPVLTFTGTPGGANTVSTGTAGAGVNTLQSFSASAWVNPATTSGTMAIMAQSGASRSGFVLEDVNGHMTFCVQPQSTSGSDCVTASATSAAGAWTLVTGIWDATNQRVRIVLGTDVTNAGVTPHTVPPGDTTAAGPVTVGSAQAAGAPSAAWDGSITDPILIQALVDSAFLSNFTSLFS